MSGKLGLVLFIVAAIGILGYFFSTRYSTSTIQNELPTNESTNQPSVSNGRYIDYSKYAFEAAKNKKRILYFHADWCPICRPLNREFMTMMDKIPEDVVVFKTDYDKETALKQKYIITYQHTFVQVDAQENQVTKWNGGTLDDVLANIQ